MECSGCKVCTFLLSFAIFPIFRNVSFSFRMKKILVGFEAKKAKLCDNIMFTFPGIL